MLSKKLSGWRTSFVVPYLKGDVLDIGCGKAAIYRDYHHLINSYCGIEYKPGAVERLTSEYPDAHFVQRDIDHEPLDLGRRFDVVLMVALIEHVWNQKFLFEQLLKCLKPDGRIIVTTPTPFGNDIVHMLGAKMGLFASAAADDHIVIYNKKRFKILADEFGLEILKYKHFQLFCNQFVVLSPKNSL